MRLLYLKRKRGATELSGREAFAGRRLYDHLAEAADDAIATHVVAAPGRGSGTARWSGCCSTSPEA